ncbi:hypothetical protein MLD52_19645 [Puniceicoccaceae bacterium K14]|nr:hypothetical protein [Puniceicoccaceae bacterium K14]
MNLIRLFIILASGFGAVFSGSFALENTEPKLINISTRGKVGSEVGQELIAGFVIEGDFEKYILIRAVGPYLAREGLEPESLLTDPYLMLVRHLEDGSIEVLEENDDWPWDEVRVDLQPFPVWGYIGGQSTDAEITIMLEPGIYSAIVSGKGGSGIALVEVYESVNGP